MESAIKAVEATRPHSGHTVTTTLTAQQTDIDLGGITARTLAYGNTVPAPLIRANVGDELANLILCLLEQTWVDGFFRHGGSGC